MTLIPVFIIYQSHTKVMEPLQAATGERCRTLIPKLYQIKGHQARLSSLFAKVPQVHPL